MNGDIQTLAILRKERMQNISPMNYSQIFTGLMQSLAQGDAVDNDLIRNIQEIEKNSQLLDLKERE